MFTPEIFVNDSNWSSSATSPTPKFKIVSHGFYLRHYPCLHCRKNYFTNIICMSICMSNIRRKTFEKSLMIGGLPSFPSLISWSLSHMLQAQVCLHSTWRHKQRLILVDSIQPRNVLSMPSILGIPLGGSPGRVDTADILLESFLNKGVLNPLA